MKRLLAVALQILLIVSVVPARARTAPLAASFSTAVAVNSQSVIQLQGSDGDGTPLTYATTSAPTHGALSQLNTSTGVLVYTPTSGYTGSDSFQYTVTSGGDTTSAATVTVTVTNAKTRIVDTLMCGSSPCTGTASFMLTQVAATPSGIMPAKASTSAVLDGSGRFDVSVYPSRAVSPVQFYQVWLDSGSGSSQFIGLYDIPASTGLITLAGHKVTDANLSAQYVFASKAEIEGLTKAVNVATLSSLNSDQVRAALGYTPLNAGLNLGDVPSPAAARTSLGLGTLATQSAGSVAITGGTASNLVLTNVTVVGSGNNGSVSNAGDTVVAADNDTNGSGALHLGTGGHDRILIANDGTVTFPEGTLFDKRVSTAGREVYASGLGAALNANVGAGCTGTTDTSVLQSGINALALAGGGTLVLDGIAVAYVTLPSNVYLRGAKLTDGLCLPSGANRPAAVNANQTSGTIVDHDLGLRDLTVYGNRVGQVKCNGSCISGGEYNVGVRLLGVTRPVVENVHILNSKNFSFHGANLVDAYVTGIAEQPDYEVDNHDGWHFNGPITRLHANVTCIKTSDDCFALNAYDPVGIFANVTNAPITDVDAHVFFDHAVFGFRAVGSGSAYVDRVSLVGKGTVQECALRIDNGGEYGGGAGAIYSLDADLDNVAMFDSGTYHNFLPAVYVRSYVEQLRVKLKQGRNWYADYRPAVVLKGSESVTNDWCAPCTWQAANVRQLDLDLLVDDPAGTDPNATGSGYRVQLEGGALGFLRYKLHHLRDASVAQSKGALWIKGATVDEVDLSGGANRQSNLIAITSGGLSRVRLGPFTNLADAGAAIFAQASGGAITAYPTVTGDLLTDGGSVLGGTGATNITTAQFFVDGAQYLQPLTYATLPSSPREGRAALITDSNTSTIGATAAGGGSNRVVVIFNGTSWTVRSK